MVWAAAKTLGTGSSSGGTRSSPARPESDTVKADPETEWTPVARPRRGRSKTPDLAVVEATKKFKSTDPTSDIGDGIKMDLTDDETRKEDSGRNDRS